VRLTLDDDRVYVQSN